MQSVLFVCLGNICRSPLAEGIFLHQARALGLELTVDSAGTGGWHAGERADSRARAVAEQNGVELPSRARQVELEDFTRFDLILAMDEDNLSTLQRRAPADATATLKLMRDYDPDGPGEVPDPYYGGDEGFQRVFDMLDRSCRALLSELSPR